MDSYFTQLYRTYELNRTYTSPEANEYVATINTLLHENDTLIEKLNKNSTEVNLTKMKLALVSLASDKNRILEIFNFIFRLLFFLLTAICIGESTNEGKGTEPLLGFILLVQIISFLRIEHWLPGLAKIPLEAFLKPFLNYQLFAIDILGITTIMVYHNVYGYTSVKGFRQSYIAFIYVSYLIHIFLGSYLRRRFPRHMNHFTFLSWTSANLVMRVTGESGSLPWLTYFDYQLAVYEMKLTGKCSQGYWWPKNAANTANTVNSITSIENGFNESNNNNNNNNNISNGFGYETVRLDDNSNSNEL